MNNQLQLFKTKWGIDNLTNSNSEAAQEIDNFKTINNLFLSKEIEEYFFEINGTNEEYNVDFFKFYSISNFKSINEDLKNWNGSPNYSNIVNTLNEYERYFVFGDYQFCMFSYAIKLYPLHENSNEILVIYGDEYKKIADSFLDFIDLYLNDPLSICM